MSSSIAPPASFSRRVFGPVPSRRLGRSLGIDLTPAKTCSYNCRYCQLPVTTHQTARRQEFFPVADLEGELRAMLDGPRPDIITFSGTGEPTLHTGLGEAIALVRRLAPGVPVAVITNGSLLGDPEVAAALRQADRVMPTCCTIHEPVFARLHRPDPALSCAMVLEGLRQFSAIYTGFLEIEVMVCEGSNDTPAELEPLAGWLGTLPRIDAIFINTPVRTPVDPTCRPTSEGVRLAERLLSAVAPLTAPKTVTAQGNTTGAPPPAERVLDLLARHPCTLDELLGALGGERSAVLTLLQDLRAKGRVEVHAAGGRVSWRIPPSWA